MTEAQAKRKKARRKGMPRSYERQRGIAERKEGFLLVSLALSLFVGVTLFFDQPCLALTCAYMFFCKSASTGIASSGVIGEVPLGERRPFRESRGRICFAGLGGLEEWRAVVDVGEAVAGATGRGVTGVYWWACKHFGVLCSSTWIFTLAASARGILGGMYMCVGTFSLYLVWMASAV